MYFAHPPPEMAMKGMLVSSSPASLDWRIAANA
jgi:hypothetical protein